MQVNISTRHGHVGTETKNKFEEKLAKLTRFNDRISTAKVVIDLENPDNAKLEVRLLVDHANDMLANTQGNNLLGALDGAIHKLEEQLRRHKDKLVEHRSTGRRTELPAENTEDVEEEEEFDPLD